MNNFLKILLLLIFSSPFVARAQNCSINAGGNQTICTGSTFSLSGSIGGPFDASTITWSVLSQPAGANVTIATPNSFATTAGTAQIVGTYVFRLSGTCGDGIPTQNDVTITVNASPAVPTQSGTSSFTCYTGSPITISGTAPAAGETVYWSVAPGQGSFSTPSSSSTNFTPRFPLDGCASSYVIPVTYTVTNASGCSRSVVKNYTFSPQYTFFAIADPTPVCGNQTLLKGSCAGSGTASWTVVSTPGGAPAPVFANAASNNTAVSNLVPGNYVFNYAVTSSCGNNNANVAVTVASGTGVSQADAGADQHYCTIPATISLSGNTPAVGETATWTQLSGGTTTTITDSTAPNTTVSGLTSAGAPYQFQYRITSAGGCITKDTVTIHVAPDLSITNLNASVCASTFLPYSTGGSGIHNRLAQFGSFAFNQLDTVTITTTYLSGPAPSIQNSAAIGSSADNTTRSNGSSVPIALGASYTRKLWNTGGSGTNELYITAPNANRETQTYYLVNTNLYTNVGTYKYRVTYATKCSTYVATITVNRGTTIAVNAGSDVALACGATTATLAGNIIDSFAAWSTVSMPSGATDPITPANQDLKNPMLTGLIPGTYIFRYANNAGSSCVQSSDEVKIVVSATPPLSPNAGADQSACAGTVTLNGSAVPGTALAQWSVISPSGAAVTFSDATIANPTVSGLLPSTSYTFRYTLTNGCGSSFDDVVITTGTTTAPAKPSISISGGDCATTIIYTLPLSPSVTVTHPALAPGETGTLSVVANPASSLTSWTQTGTTATTKTIQVTLSDNAAVSYIWCVSNASCPSQSYCDTVTTYFMLNGTGASAGADQQLCSVSSFPTTVTLSGSANAIPKNWSLVYSSNGQPVSFGSPTNNTTTVSLPAEGTYKFKYELISLDPACNGRNEDYVTVVVSSPGALAQAGNDTTVCNASGTFNLSATPLVTGTGKWEIEDVLSGTAPVISNVNAATSAITFSQSGTVTLRWSSYGSNPVCGPSSTDLVTVTYIAPANAGSDISLCDITSTNLDATAADPATGTWSQISGPNAAAIASTTNPNTLISGLVPGAYTFRWTISGTSCTSFDDVVVTINSTVATADAGSDFVTCADNLNNAIALHATAATIGMTGTWEVRSYPAGASVGAFSNVNDPNAVYTGATEAGTYIFSWTVNDGECSISDFVAVTVDPSSCITISGTVFDDANGNTLIDGSESSTGIPNNLYVYLVNSDGVIIDSAAIQADGTYTLDATKSTAYTISLSAVSYPVGTNTNTTPIDHTLPTGWVTTGENNEGNTGAGDGTPNGILPVTTGTVNFTDANFGIEQPPVATTKSFTVPNSSFSTTPPAGYPAVSGYQSIASSSPDLTGYDGTGGKLSGSDPEDCTASNTCNTGSTFTIDTINSNTVLYYDFGAGPVQLTGGTTISNYDPTKLIIYGQNGSGTSTDPIGFTYTITDAAGVTSPVASYTIITSNPLPLKLLTFEGLSKECIVTLNWTTVEEQHFSHFEVEYGTDAQTFSKVGAIPSQNLLTGSRYSFNYKQDGNTGYYRLKMVDMDGASSYSTVLVMNTDCKDASIKVYPSPAKDYVKITGLSDKAMIKLIDANGKVVLTQAHTSGSACELNLHSYPSGAYYIQVAEGAVNSTFKIHIIR